MDKKYLEKAIVLVLIICVLGIFDYQQLNAQVQGTERQVVKWLSTSALRSWFSNMGAEAEFCRRDRATYIAVDQIDGLCWPNEFNIRMKGVKDAGALWIGATNFADPVSNVTYPYKVVCIGKDAIYSGTEIFTDELTSMGQFPHPSINVDGVSASAREYDDMVDKVDNTLPADRVMMNRFHTSIGVSVTRKVLSFSQQYNNNYYIYEYTFKNTGIIDESGLKKLNVSLTGVVFYMQSRLSFAGVSYTGKEPTGAGSWSPSTSSWGRNTINDVIRKDGSTPGEFRAVFSHWGANTQHLATLYAAFVAGTATIPGVTINAPEHSSHAIVNVRFSGVRSDRLLMRLDLAGVAAAADSPVSWGASNRAMFCWLAGSRWTLYSRRCGSVFLVRRRSTKCTRL